MRKLDCGHQTLAEKLRELRRGKAITLEIMEAQTHIQKKYLEALERGYFEQLPEPIYVRNFIRAYTRLLGADETYFLELYEEECGACDLIGPLSSPRQKVERKKFFIWNNFLRFGVFGAIICALFVYIGFQVFSIIQSPKIIVFSPANDTLTHEAQLSVKGIVKGEASVFINGEPVVVDENNTFNTSVDLQEGLNTLVIEAERRYSKKSVIQRSVVFDPKPWITQVSYYEN